MTRAWLGGACALALATSACGHVEMHEIVLRAPSAPAAGEPEIYFDGRWPERAFYEVALMQAVGFGSDANPEDVTRALAARGRQQGCDAIVRVRIDQGYTRANGFGVCVRYSPPEPAATPAPTPTPTPSPGA